MCTLAAYVGMSPAVPLLVAANRDEFLARPATAPGILAYDPWVVAGQDLSAGGTWFGVNQHGMVVGLLNRRRAAGTDPTRRSRGLLCLELLQTSNPSAARQRLRAERGDAYNGFNLLVADALGAFVATNAERAIAVTPLPRGVHLLTNLELNDPTCPRIARSSRLFARLAVPADAGALGDVVPALRAILADHTTALDPRAHPLEPLCVHLPDYGTRSSSIVALTSGGETHFWHAAGPPCVTPHTPVPLPTA